MKSVFDEGNSIKTNDIVSKIKEFNRIKEKLQEQNAQEGLQPNDQTIDASLVPRDEI